MDHQEQHHEKHEHEREHKKELRKEHEHREERTLRSLHPGWFVLLAVLAVFAAIMVWTFLLRP